MWGWITEHATVLSAVVTAMCTVAIAWFTWKLADISAEQGSFNERALVANRRAFVFLQRVAAYFTPTPEDMDKPGDALKAVVSWSFRPVWENSGETHTKNMTIHTDHELRDSRLPLNFAFRDNQNAHGVMLLGPKAAQAGGATREFTTSELLEVQSGKRFLYVWGWVKYNDIFPGTPNRITRFCGQVIVSGDPAKSSAVFTYPIHPAGNCADDECAGLG